MDIQPLSAEMRQGQYSKVVAWEVWNFMSIEYAKVEFDGTNIINIKGYNDSGKSAMLRALDVLMFNIKPNAQLDMIQDDKEYFRVMAYFDDGVCILRDKYINGQGLYELYKGNEVLFSTKQNGALTKISAVPDVIRDYLGLITSSDWNINSRSCFEKQLLVQTTGSENNRALNEVLRSEELAKAGEMLNADKNKVKSELSVAETELDLYKKQISNSRGVSKELLEALRENDKILDLAEDKFSSLCACKETQNSLSEIPQIPELIPVNASQLSDLSAIADCDIQIAEIPSIPEVNIIDISRVSLLEQISTLFMEINRVQVAPECSEIDNSRLELIVQIANIFSECASYDNIISNLDKEQADISESLVDVQKQLDELGQKFTICPNCGAVISSEAHSH